MHAVAACGLHSLDSRLEARQALAARRRSGGPPRAHAAPAQRAHVPQLQPRIRHVAHELLQQLQHARLVVQQRLRTCRGAVRVRCVRCVRVVCVRVLCLVVQRLRARVRCVCVVCVRALFGCGVPQLQHTDTAEARLASKGRQPGGMHAFMVRT